MRQIKWLWFVIGLHDYRSTQVLIKLAKACDLDRWKAALAAAIEEEEARKSDRPKRMPYRRWLTLALSSWAIVLMSAVFQWILAFVVCGFALLAIYCIDHD